MVPAQLAIQLSVSDQANDSVGVLQALYVCLEGCVLMMPVLKMYGQVMRVLF